MIKKTLITLTLLLSFYKTWGMEYGPKGTNYNAQAQRTASEIFLHIWDLTRDRLSSHAGPVTTEKQIDIMCEMVEELIKKSSYDQIIIDLVRNRIFSAFIPQAESENSSCIQS